MIRTLNLCLFTVILLLCSCSKSKDSYEAYLPSPDSRIHIYFNHNKGEPYYLVYYRNEIIIDWSLLGFTLSDNISLTDNLMITNTKSKSEKYRENEPDMDTITIKGDYNEMTIGFEKVNNPKLGFDLVLRSYNKGIAFRYIFKGEGTEKVSSILSEETQFNLNVNIFNWTLAQDTSDLPVTFIADKRFSVIIDETIEVGYPKMKLKSVSNDKTRFKCLLNRKNADPLIKIEAEVKSPWRIIFIKKIVDQKNHNKDES